ncbi:hypothetical protein CYLTODRAFT_486114 [Cylindrobasidium torrendii FP15055 ss-10]|uniref:GDP/GTP exchange factor Sec2 N-terminal domain-containing protein n=1 Tax=Cylindrobasidium torrendii FP15055 ss-10 TaxID=1314674 RepID=A0A0D7BQ08_9AGAR|nr:hypothetical protein CYLTODRAFT_486114 [Cylindrobasidium torrendii FP15055 ss-10]
MAQDDQVQETHATTNGTNGTTSPTTSDDTNLKRTRHGSDVNAQDMVIASLRSQVDDLFSQVTQLNGKLVKSYDRVSDLEDNLHVAETGARISTKKITELEAERTQHLAALNTGLLVERQHVTAELTRLMEKATEEAAQRGQAESARADIEKDLDDLSATLFDQANTMVAEARFARAQSERKVEDAEGSLKVAEEAVAQMQLQMQALQAEKEDAQRIAEEMQITMGKGKWAQRSQPSIALPPLRLLCSHLPYQEFLLFVAHLRTLHLSTASPPAMSTLLPLPFIARLTNEDSEPSLRLDIAPSLNWLSRRTVLSAIHHGQLSIEPVSSSLIHQESFFANQGNPATPLLCALCGEPVFPSTSTPASHNRFGSWSSSILKKYTMNGNATPPMTPPPLPDSAPEQVYVFRVSSPTALPGAGLPGLNNLNIRSTSHSPSNSTTAANSQPHTITTYALCTNGWCLTRLRQTCTLWAFVRANIVEKVWEEEVPNLPVVSPPSTPAEPPPTPRRLWAALSWGGKEKEKEKEKEKAPEEHILDEKMRAKEKEFQANKNKPLPPPAHPNVIRAPKPVPALPPRNDNRRVPPPFLKSTSPIAHTHSPLDDAPSRQSPGTPDHVAEEVTPGKDDAEKVDEKLVSEPPPTDEKAEDDSAGIPEDPTTVAAVHVPLPPSRPATPISPAGAPPPIPKRAARRPLSAIMHPSRPGTPSMLRTSLDSPKEGNEEKKVPEVTAQTATPVDTAQPELPVPAAVASSAPPLPARRMPRGPRGPSPTITPSTSEVNLLEEKDDVFSDGPGSKKEDNTADEQKEEHHDESQTVSPSHSDEFKDAQEEPDHADADDHHDTESIFDADDPDVHHRHERRDTIRAQSRVVSRQTSPSGSAIEKPEVRVFSDDKRRLSTDTNMFSHPDDLGFVDEPDDDDEIGKYIGNATWEERTWRDLVKIKEELFLARVGASR